MNHRQTSNLLYCFSLRPINGSLLVFDIIFIGTLEGIEARKCRNITICAMDENIYDNF